MIKIESFVLFSLLIGMCVKSSGHSHRNKKNLRDVLVFSLQFNRRLTRTLLLQTFQTIFEWRKIRETFPSLPYVARIERLWTARERAKCVQKCHPAEECAVHSPYQYNSSCIGQGMNGCCILFLILSFAFLFSCLRFFFSLSLPRMFLIILLPSELCARLLSTKKVKFCSRFIAKFPSVNIKAKFEFSFIKFHKLLKLKT